MKYRLKKDLPDLEAGEIFDATDSFGHDTSSMFDSTGTYRFEKDDIKHFDEWFEEVKELGWWKPRAKEKYFYIGSHGEVCRDTWFDSTIFRDKLSVGNTFKTEEAANRWRDYLKAVETVRHDEGFMEPSAEYHHGHGIGINCYGEPYAEQMYTDHYAGRFYFDSSEHAKASVVAHQSEWKTILDYDWSRE